MSVARILCLANSYKHDHRCVAGINLDSKKWVRLVGNKVPGCLTREECCYRDGSEAAILDVFEAELGESCATPSHPEDIKIAEKLWKPLRRFDEPRDALLLSQYVSKEPSVLNGCGDRVYVRKFAVKAAPKSIELIHPEDVWWWIRDDTGKRKNRAVFRIGRVSRVRYDLAVTDPVWLAKLHLLAPGIYPHASVCAGTPGKTLFTASLSEPFDGFHYKLIAGVICLPFSEGSSKSHAHLASTAGTH
jgi:hypothetical protein